MRDLYQEITDRVVAALEAGTAPWVRPWEDRGGNGVAVGMPYNAISKRQYSGVNVPLLWMTASERGYQGNGWATFNQVREAGGSVRKGERGTMIVFAKQITREDDDGKTKSFPVLRSFVVFHTSQCEGLDVVAPDAPVIDKDRVLDWVVSTGARVEHGGNKAFYTTRTDHIQMPMLKAFRDRESYAATLLHELTHWSGNAARLNRQFGKRFGDDAYAAEELVAEMGAAFLCARLGVRGELQHESYIASWLKALKGDKRFLFAAASNASKAAEYLCGLASLPVEEHDGEDGQPVAADNVVVFPRVVVPSVPLVRPGSLSLIAVPDPSEYAPRGEASGLLELARLEQSNIIAKRRKYSGSFPLSANQRALYADGIGHASGYWRDYVAGQRSPSRDPHDLARELVAVYEKRGHIPSEKTAAGCPELEQYRRHALSRITAEAAE